MLRAGGKQVIKWTAEGAVNGIQCSVFCNVRHTSIARDMLVSLKRTATAVNQGGTADRVFVLDRILFCQGLFYFTKSLAQRRAYDHTEFRNITGIKKTGHLQNSSGQHGDPFRCQNTHRGTADLKKCIRSLLPIRVCC